jgi:elongator complex protein 3
MDILETTIKGLIKSKAKTLDDLGLAKRKSSKNCKTMMPTNISLLKRYHELVENGKIKKSPQIELLLKTRPVRSLSGIVNISVLTKPYPCPGKCLYCPTESDIPKSYVSGEPAVERAKTLKFNPYLQTKRRIEMLGNEGHPTDKIELRIVGGTWSYYPEKYQKWFIKRCFDACNNKPAKNLKAAQKINEKTKNRIVGLSIETRPDFINEKEIKRLRELGATMIELGVQSIYDDVLRLNLRGHLVNKVILATKLLKDAGFKVLYQMMPNLPGSDLKRDEKMFKNIFQNQNFQPDLLKIYPCALLKEAPLYKLWKNGKYKHFSEKQLMKLIGKIKKEIPYYVRIQRIARDIPSSLIVAGPAKISNFRQILKEKMEKDNWRCKCIRCREVKDTSDKNDKLSLFRQDYLASLGKEIFLSFENEKRTKLYSLLRLRITSEGKAIIRELHTFGPAIPIKEKKGAVQHAGFGKKLLEKAEKITKNEFGLKEISVIAGVGAREYYKKQGYKTDGTYVSKKI